MSRPKGQTAKGQTALVTGSAPLAARLDVTRPPEWETAVAAVQSPRDQAAMLSQAVARFKPGAPPLPA